MSRPATAQWATAAGRVVEVEYVRSRGVLRMKHGPGPGDAVEVRLDEFCARLGIDLTALAPPRRFLLFAGVSDGAHAAARHVVKAFASEEDARRAFHVVRSRCVRPADWAEVASLEASGQLRTRCWFGAPWAPGGREGDARGAAPPTEGSRRSQWRAHRAE